MENINIFIVFIEGILSIFSPCILPILPIYLSILSNSSVQEIKSKNGNKKTLLINTLFFILGISITFFILGSSLRAVTSFFNNNRNIFTLISGILIIIMGLFYLGILKINLLNQEKRFAVKTETMSPITAFVLGFTFSFGWTPCIGPILASVLLMSSSSSNNTTSTILILVYTLGFIIPFILASLFYHKLYKKFDKMKEYMTIIKRISGIIIICAGIIMLYDSGKNMYQENKILKNQVEQAKQSSNNEQSNIAQEKDTANSDETENSDKLLPIDFTLTDQYGNEHTLSDYKGKVVFLNFWATWCPPCKAEMPDMDALHNEYTENGDDVVILGVASPNLGREGSEEKIKDFLNEEGFSFPVVFDEGGSMVYQYGINAFPSTLIIDKEGYIVQYIPGAMSKDSMKQVIDAAK